jgi:hypothetical protein
MIVCALKTYLLFLLYPALLIALILMSIAVICDSAAFRLGIPVPQKGPWEF